MCVVWMQVIVTTVNKIDQVVQALSGVVTEDTTLLLALFVPVGESLGSILNCVALVTHDAAMSDAFWFMVETHCRHFWAGNCRQWRLCSGQVCCRSDTATHLPTCV
jgi:hypothetical protein